MATKKLGPFNLGVNTRLPDTGLSIPKVGTYLRSGVNVDLTADGKIRRRKGTTSVRAGTACHSLWADGSVGYYADGVNLYRIRTGPASTLSRETVRSDLIIGLRLSYAVVGDTTYYSNGVNFGMLKAASASSDWGTLPNLTDPALASYLFRPLPVGIIVRAYKASLLSVQGSTLYVSEPHARNVYNPARGFISFNSAINMLAATDDGVYVGTEDGVYWLAGELSETTVNPVLPYPAITGSDSMIPNSNSVMWASTRGLVRGDTDGTVTNLQEKNIDTGKGRVGATLFRELDGMKKALSSVFSVEASRASASSFMSMEIIRKGIVL